MEQLARKSAEILLVEDNEGDILIAKEVFKSGDLKKHIHVAEDGEEAINFLRKQEGFKDAVSPDLILLDINLPKKNGIEVLKEIKEDPELRKIPVIMLSSSSAERDIVESYDLHANGYITKPAHIGKFVETVEAIEKFWLTAATLPGSNDK